MGVPVTFIGKWNPTQFDLIKIKYNDDHKHIKINGKDVFTRIIIKKRR